MNNIQEILPTNITYSLPWETFKRQSPPPDITSRNITQYHAILNTQVSQT